MYRAVSAGARLRPAAVAAVRHQSNATGLPSWVGVRINGKKALVHPKASVLQACEEGECPGAWAVGVERGGPR